MKEDGARTLATVSAAMKAAGFTLKKDGDLKNYPVWLWNRGNEDCSVTIEPSEKVSRSVVNGTVDLSQYPVGVTVLYVASGSAAPKASASATSPPRGAKRPPAH